MCKREFDVRECEKAEELLLKKYSTVKRFVIAKTELSRKIVSYTVGGSGGVLMCGTFHGMERLGAQVLYRFLMDVCDRARRDRAFAKSLEHTGLTVVPMVNPDGVEVSVNSVKTAGRYKELISECLVKAGVDHTKWQSNARGVDINHNFDAGFKELKKREREMGICCPSHTRYGGKYPESEKETKALCELCRQNSFSVAVALHTQGREIYYDYGEHTPRESLGMANDMAKLSGYAVSQPPKIATGGGFKDWFIEKFHRPAFTLEMGVGENPLPPDTINSEYKRVSKMLWYLLHYAIKNSDE